MEGIFFCYGRISHVKLWTTLNKRNNHPRLKRSNIRNALLLESGGTGVVDPDGLYRGCVK